MFCNMYDQVNLSYNGCIAQIVCNKAYDTRLASILQESQDSQRLPAHIVHHSPNWQCTGHTVCYRVSDTQWWVQDAQWSVHNAQSIYCSVHCSHCALHSAVDSLQLLLVALCTKEVPPMQVYTVNCKKCKQGLLLVALCTKECTQCKCTQVQARPIIGCTVY